MKKTGALIIAAQLMLFTVGCGASFFSAQTQARHEIVHPDGTRIITSYDSGKEQNGFDASWTETPTADGTIIKTIHVKVDKATTVESAIAAASLAQAEFMKAMQVLLSQLVALAKMAPK